MQRIFLAAIFLCFAFIINCNDDGIGPGGGGNISFAISGQIDPTNQNNYIFGFQPSVDTKLKTVIVGLPAQTFFDTLTSNDSNYVLSKDTIYTIGPYTNVQTGQDWTFQFAGNVVSNNQAYTVVTNFIIP